MHRDQATWGIIFNSCCLTLSTQLFKAFSLVDLFILANQVQLGKKCNVKPDWPELSLVKVVKSNLIGKNLPVNQGILYEIGCWYTFAETDHIDCNVLGMEIPRRCKFFFKYNVIFETPAFEGANSVS